MARIKTDFITNSSSSSFVAWGVSLDDIVFPDEVLLKVFSNKLEYLKELKEKDPDSFNRWHKEDYETMLSLTEDHEKTQWVEDLDFEEKSEILMKDAGSKFTWSTQFDSIGIAPNDFINKYPDVKAREIKATIANELNATFGTKFTENSIQYIEESEYNG